MHDVETAMLQYITCVLKSRLNLCGALKAGRLIVQTYIDTVVFFLPM